jgi:hypothetical protein
MSSPYVVPNPHVKDIKVDHLYHLGEEREQTEEKKNSQRQSENS